MGGSGEGNSVGREVVEGGVVEVLSQVVQGTLSGGRVLGCESKEGEHRQPSVLQLLQLVLLAVDCTQPLQKTLVMASSMTEIPLTSLAPACLTQIYLSCQSQ